MADLLFYIYYSLGYIVPFLLNLVPLLGIPKNLANDNLEFLQVIYNIITFINIK